MFLLRYEKSLKESYYIILIFHLDISTTTRTDIGREGIVKLPV